MTNQEWRFVDRINQHAADLCEQSIHEAHVLDIEVSEVAEARVLDFGANRHGCLAGGIRLAEICLADLADVDLQAAVSGKLSLPMVAVRTDFPVEACIAAQYAGWPVHCDDFFAMGSGPARSLRGKEEILKENKLSSNEKTAVVVLESNQRPTKSAIELICDECRVQPENLFVCLARTASFPGTIQVVARSVETTLHKLHEVEFDITTVKAGIGFAPLPPIAKDDLTALGWTNDAILYGGKVNLWVDVEDEAVVAAGQNLPSSSSLDFGEPFLNIFERYDRDFYKIDKMLFSPAMVMINNLASGNSFQFGSVREDVLGTSFGIEV